MMSDMEILRTTIGVESHTRRDAAGARTSDDVVFAGAGDSVRHA